MAIHTQRRVLLVEGSDDFVSGLRSWLETSAGLEVVGSARMKAEALAKAETLRPDLVVVDVSLPDCSGFDLTRQLKLQSPRAPVVLVSFHIGKAVREEAHAAGADACISQADVSEHLIPIIDSVLGNGPPIEIRHNGRRDGSSG